MSKRELEKGEMIAQVMREGLTQKQAAEKLGMSARHVRRLCQRYRETGVAGLAHRARGKTSNRKISDESLGRVLEIIIEKYQDFGPQLLKEVLERQHGLEFSREWLRRLMTNNGL